MKIYSPGRGKDVYENNEQKSRLAWRTEERMEECVIPVRILREGCLRALCIMLKKYATVLYK